MVGDDIFNEDQPRRAFAANVLLPVHADRVWELALMEEFERKIRQIGGSRCAEVVRALSASIARALA